MASKKQGITFDRSPVRFEHEGEEYVLEFDKHAVLTLSRMYGINALSLTGSEDGDRFLEFFIRLDDVFYMALGKNQKGISRAKSDELFSLMGDKMELAQELIRLMCVPLADVMQAGEQGKAISLMK